MNEEPKWTLPAEPEKKPEKPKKKRSVRIIIARALLFTGLGLVIFALGYEAVNYPWRTLFYNREEQIDDLPEPEPLNFDEMWQDYLSSAGTEEDHWEGVDDTTPSAAPVPVMPGDDGLFSSEARSYDTNPDNMRDIYLGWFKVPILGVSANFLEGAGAEMKYGMGRVPGTQMPGEEGNCVISGHRNFIRMHPAKHFDKLVKGDKVIIKCYDVVYTYEVYKSFTVQPSEVWVLKPDKDEEQFMLTLITCDPVISPYQRLIVRCKLIKTEPPAA